MFMIDVFTNIDDVYFIYSLDYLRIEQNFGRYIVVGCSKAWDGIG